MVSLCAYGQSDGRRIKVLFAGNSYTFYNDLVELVEMISEETSTPLSTTESAVGGATLEHHWNFGRNLQTKKLIENTSYDIVVLQDQSLRPINSPNLTLQDAARLSSHILKHGAKPYFFSTWPRKKSPEHQSKLHETYRIASQANNGELVPIGQGWALARKRRPNLPLYDEDGSHPSPLGSFFTAMIFVGKISGEIPARLSGDRSSEYYRLLTKQFETAKGSWDYDFLRMIALDVLQTEG